MAFLSVICVLHAEGHNIKLKDITKAGIKFFEVDWWLFKSAALMQNVSFCDV